MGPGRSFRTYAFCSKSHGGGVTLLWLKCNKDSVKLKHALSGPQESYLLTSPAITSREILLNGKTLGVDAATGELTTELKPRVFAAGVVLSLPPQSYGFIEFPAAGAAACAKN